MLSNKEWIKATLAHQETGAVPYNYSFAPPIARGLREHYGVESIPDRLNLPMRMTGPISPKPMYADPAQYGPTVSDEFGVVWSTTEIDRGAPHAYPLTAPDLSGYTFPDPADPTRFAGMAEWCASNRQHYTGMRVGEVWERATFLRGMEDLLYDLAEEPEFQAFRRGETVRVHMDAGEDFEAVAEPTIFSDMTAAAEGDKTVNGVDGSADVFEREYRQGLKDMEDRNWVGAIHHLSISAALRPGAFEVKDKLREARRMRAKELEGRA
jgi:hypothetical protein